MLYIIDNQLDSACTLDQLIEDNDGMLDQNEIDQLRELKVGDSAFIGICKVTRICDFNIISKPFDIAINEIQIACNIKSGDMAAYFFSFADDEYKYWKNISEKEAIEDIKNWLLCECEETL